MVQVAQKALSEMLLPASHVEDWLQGIATGRQPKEVDKIRDAAHFAIEAHHGQKSSPRGEDEGCHERGRSKGSNESVAKDEARKQHEGAKVLR